MAQKASGETIAADMRPPNYRAAVQRLKTIKAKKDRIAGINGDIADVFAKVEGHKVNKKAARMFLVLNNLEVAERNQVFRDLNGLLDAAGMDEDGQDLVDAAEGNVVHHRFGRDADDDGADDEAHDDELDALEDEAGTDTASSNPLDAARQHLSGMAEADADLSDAAE